MESRSRAAVALMAVGAATAIVACKVLPRAEAIDATAHDVDVGTATDGESVRLTGLAITGVAIADGVESSSQKCRYRAFAQDPAGAAPCGLVLYALGEACPGASCTCPPLPSSGTVLDAMSTLGDVYDVEGVVSVLGEGADGGAPMRHGVYLGSATRTGTDGFITPLPVSVSTDYGKGGAGYTTHESMLVKLSTGASFPVAKPDSAGSFAAAGGAWVSGDYRAAWWQDGGFPTALTELQSITGVASPIAAGGITPRTPDDFGDPTVSKGP